MFSNRSTKIEVIKCLKKIEGYIKLQIQAGQANPSPPVGPALGQHGVNIMEFCKAFNAKTQEMLGKLFLLKLQFMLIDHLHLLQKLLQHHF